LHVSGKISNSGRKLLHLIISQPLALEAGMRIWRAMKVFYEIVTDREVYFLLGLALKDLFRTTKSDPKPAVVVKKRAKAMSAGRS
jgi:hypothetical protein